MAADQIPVGHRDAARDALEAALGGYFAAQRLESRSLAYFYGSAVPSLALWVHSWHPLPDLVTWFAVLGWGMCACIAVVLAAGASRQRARAAAVLPEANRVARIQFATTEDLPPASSLLFGLSAIASSLLWIHGLSPALLPGASTSIAGKAWAVMLIGAIANRFLERA